MTEQQDKNDKTEKSKNSPGLENFEKEKPAGVSQIDVLELWKNASRIISSKDDRQDVQATRYDERPGFNKDSNKSNNFLPEFELSTTAKPEAGPVGDKHGKDNSSKSSPQADNNSEKNAMSSKFSMGTSPQREELLSAIKNSPEIGTARKESMIHEMAAFEARANRDKLSRADVLGVWQATSKILNARGSEHTTPKERGVLAEQIIKQAAHPMSIDQGHHNTCNVATIEARTYAKYPARAAGLVADVALSGEYTTASNQKIKIADSSLKPDSEAKNNPVVDGDRSYASQVFQVTAANIFWQEKKSDLQGNLKNPGDLRYVQEKPWSKIEGDTGERVKDYSTNPEGQTIKSGSTKVIDPNLYAENMMQISNEITGKDELRFILRHTELGWNHNLWNIRDQQDLTTQMTRMKDSFPLIIQVHTRHEPFYTDSGEGKAGGSGGWHVVNITKYDPVTKEVTISNQWGSKLDKKVKISDLYKATKNP